DSSESCLRRNLCVNESVLNVIVGPESPHGRPMRHVANLNDCSLDISGRLGATLTTLPYLS
ncbi:MAG: hypothetical protein ACLQKA_15310, partial [Bryobacteraceae bacterium]